MTPDQYVEMHAQICILIVGQALTLACVVNILRKRATCPRCGADLDP